MSRLANRYSYGNKNFLALDGEDYPEKSPIDFDKIPRNYEGFRQIRDLCEFGTSPVEGKVVVAHSGIGYGHTRYRVVDNPIGMPTDLIALFCDSGNLYFGYHVTGREICVHTD